MKDIKLILLFLIIINLYACAIAPEKRTARTLILEGKSFEERKPGDLT